MLFLPFFLFQKYLILSGLPCKTNKSYMWKESTWKRRTVNDGEMLDMKRKETRAHKWGMWWDAGLEHVIMLFVCSVDEMNIDHDCHVFVFRCVFVTVCKLYPLLQVFREESWKHQLKEQQRRDKIKSSEMKEKSYRQYFHYHHSCVAKKKKSTRHLG